MQNIREVLRSLYMPGSCKGFYLLDDCIEAISKNEDAIFNRNKGLYAELAKKHNTSVECVERNIRNAIQKMWNCCDHDLLNAVAGYKVKDKPTIAEMLDILLSYLSRQQKG